jgi:hypothetical protein
VKSNLGAYSAFFFAALLSLLTLACGTGPSSTYYPKTTCGSVHSDSLASRDKRLGRVRNRHYIRKANLDYGTDHHPWAESFHSSGWNAGKYALSYESTCRRWHIVLGRSGLDLHHGTIAGEWLGFNLCCTPSASDHRYATQSRPVAATWCRMDRRRWASRYPAFVVFCDRS